MGCTGNGKGINRVQISQPLESNGAIPVNVQDQTTPPFDLYFVQQKGSTTTNTVATAIGDLTITVASVASFSVGDYLGIFSGTGRFYFGTVLSILGNDLTLDTPLDFAFPIGSNTLSFTRDLNVNATPASPSYFQIQAGAAGLEIDITRFMLAIGTNNPGNVDQFGDLPALTNGLVLRRIDTVYRNIWNIKTNLEFGLHAYDLQPFSAVGPGGDGLISRYTFAGQDKHGVTIRLGPNEALQLIIQDNLSGLVSFRCLAEGHEVTD